MAEVETALPAVLGTLDRIARVDVGHTRGYGTWTPAEVAPYPSWAESLLAIAVETPRIPGWRAALAASQVGQRPFDVALEALRALAPYLPDDRHLVHGDLLSRNLLVGGDAVTAVLDWGNALYGDLYDAAWLIYWWPWYPQWNDINIRFRLDAHWRATGQATARIEERLLAYQLHIGLDAIAYCAYKGRWNYVQRNADTVLALAGFAR